MMFPDGGLYDGNLPQLRLTSVLGKAALSAILMRSYIFSNTFLNTPFKMHISLYLQRLANDRTGKPRYCVFADI